MSNSKSNLKKQRKLNTQERGSLVTITYSVLTLEFPLIVISPAKNQNSHQKSNFIAIISRIIEVLAKRLN